MPAEDSPVKIALIGVGSFVFGPSALYDSIVVHNLPDLQLVRKGDTYQTRYR